MKKYYIIVFTTILALFTFYQTNALAAGDKAIFQAENVLSNKNIVALVEINLKQALEADKIIFENSEHSHLIKNLLTSNVILNSLEKETIDQILASYSIAGDKIENTIIVFGNFSKEKVLQELEKLHTIRQKFSDRKDIFEVFNEDFQNCKILDPVSIHITENRIIISPSDVKGILQGFANNTKADTSLELFRKFKKGNFISVGIFNPDNAKNIITDKYLKYFAYKADKAESLYINASFDKKSSNINLKLDIKSKDSNWNKQLTESVKLFKQGIEKEENTSRYTALSKIKNLSITEAPMAITASFDKENLQLSNNIYNEIYNMVLFGFEKENPDEIAKSFEGGLVRYEFKEKITENDVQPFLGMKNKIFFDARSVAGPFGINLVREIKLDRKNSINEIEVEFISNQIPNINTELSHILGNNSQARIYITAAENIDEESIFRKETYCKNRNDTPTDLELFNYLIFSEGKIEQIYLLKGTKKFRMKQENALHHLAVIKGYFELDLNLEIKKEVIKEHFDGKEIKNEIFDISFDESPKNEIRYKINNSDKVLAIRAMDNDKKYLERVKTSRFFANEITGEKLISLTYNKDIDSVEIIYATKTETVKYPFELRLQMEKLKFSNEKKKSN